MRNKQTQNDSELAESVETLKEDFHQFKDDIKSLLIDLGKTSKEGVASAGRHIRNGAKSGLDEVSNRVKRAKEYGAEKLADFGDDVKAHPYMTALIALGVGAVVGRFFRR